MPKPALTEMPNRELQDKQSLIGGLATLEVLAITVIGTVGGLTLMAAGGVAAIAGVVVIGASASLGYFFDKERELTTEAARREVLQQLVKAGDLSRDAAIRYSPGLSTAFEKAVAPASPAAPSDQPKPAIPKDQLISGY